MAVNPSPFGPKPQFELADGTPAVGNKLFFYVAGSVNTKQNTYTNSTGGVANTNPIVLNSLGMPTTEIWFTAGQAYKVVYAPSTDTDPPTSPIWTIDNLLGINDTTSAQTEWIAGPAPTFINGTSFSIAGDQTSIFTVGRRIRTTNTSGTVYSTIVSSVFGVVTTITVVNDSGALDSGLSAVSYGLLQATNKSIPPFDMIVYLTSIGGTANAITASALKSAAGYSTGQVFLFTPGSINTGATTLNINGLGVKNIFSDNAACVGGELKSGVPVAVMYDGTQFQIIGRRFFKQPTRQVLLSGTGATYTTPAGATRIYIRAVGAGGGGGGATANTGTDGTDTTFSTLTAGKGFGGGSNSGTGGLGGTATGGDLNLSGAKGQGALASGLAIATPGGQGGGTPFGAGAPSTATAAGSNAAANTGAGGGGGGANANTNSGAGGGSGGYLEKTITAPAATYTYTVGAGGAGGTAGTNAGGNGASGLIVVDEWYD